MRVPNIVSVVVFLVGALVPPAFSQSAEDVASLRRDIDAVRDTQKVILGELEAIKKLLQQVPPPAPGPVAAGFKEAVLALESAPAKGDPKAKVTLVEFSDFQCPYCGRNFQQVYPQVYEQYVKTGKVRYVFLDFPLESMHPFAFKASVAARCAGAEGKFWEMHDKLFTKQTALAEDALMGYAKELGLNGPSFKECLEGVAHDARIRADMAQGQAAGVTGTPAFLLGLTQPKGARFTAVRNIPGAQPFEAFRAAIDALLAAGPVAGK